MKTVTMIGAHRRIVPGGFCIQRKRKIPSPREIRDAAVKALASRLARGKEVHP